MGCYVSGVLYLPDELIATVRTRVTRVPKGDAVRGFVNEFNAAALGARRADAWLDIASATASQTVTCDRSQAVDNTDTLVIAGTTLSEKASPANESQYAKGASNLTLATNLVNTINAHSVISKLVWAQLTTAASGIFTIYSIYPGPVGNLITLSTAGNSLTLGNTTLLGGASDAVKELQLGYSASGHVAG